MVKIVDKHLILSVLRNNHINNNHFFVAICKK